MKAFGAWWQSLTPREHVLLSTMMVLGLVIAIAYGIIAPINRHHEAGVRAVAAARADAARIEAAVAEARSLAANGASRPNGTKDVRAALSEKAAALGITVTRLQPEANGGLNVWIDGADPALLYRLMMTLQEEHGVSVTRASLQMEDGTNAVRAQLRLQGASS